jgi:hypothetical protein
LGDDPRIPPDPSGILRDPTITNIVVRVSDEIYLQILHSVHAWEAKSFDFRDSLGTIAGPGVVRVGIPENPGSMRF